MPYKDKEKQKAAQAAHYQKNKGQYKESSKLARDRRYRKYYALKNQPCSDCGLKFPPTMMHFDHLGESPKNGDVSRLISNVGWDTLLKEIEKCDLVCIICHGLRTLERATQLGTISDNLSEYYETFLRENADKYKRPLQDVNWI